MGPREIVVAAAVVGVLAGCSGPSDRRADPAASPVETAPAATPASTVARPTSSTTAATTTTLAPPTTRPTVAATSATPATPVATNPPRAATSAASCPTNLASQLAYTARSQQLITVVAAGWGTSSARVQLWQRSGNCWVSAGGPWISLIGQNGFSDHHIEGDGTTPTGFYGVGPVMYGNAPDPGVKETYHRLVCGDWWDEDPNSPEYNTFQHVACNDPRPFGGGSEALWEETRPYPSFAVVDYNTGPIVRGAGSAIFFHADTGSPTTGCVSIPLADLDFALRWINPADAPAFVMGPAMEIAHF